MHVLVACIMAFSKQCLPNIAVLHGKHTVYWHVQVCRVQELIRQVGLAPTKAKNICSMSKVRPHLPVEQNLLPEHRLGNFHIYIVVMQCSYSPLPLSYVEVPRAAQACCALPPLQHKAMQPSCSPTTYQT